MILTENSRRSHGVRPTPLRSLACASSSLLNTAHRPYLYYGVSIPNIRLALMTSDTSGSFTVHSTLYIVTCCYMLLHCITFTSIHTYLIS